MFCSFRKTCFGITVRFIYEKSTIQIYIFPNITDNGQVLLQTLITNKNIFLLFFFFFYADHPLQGFRSHCCVRGYSSLLVATAGAEATTRTGRQHTRTHTHTHTHTQPPTQPFITSKHDMKSLLVREQVDGSTVLSTKTKYIQGHSTKLLLPEGTMV